jgi:uncharacterized protein
MEKHMNEILKQEYDTMIVKWSWREIAAVFALVVAALVAVIIALRLVIHMTGMDIIGIGMTSPALYIASATVYGAMLLGIYWFAARRSGWDALGLRMPPRWALVITPLLLVVELAGMASINMIIAYIRGEVFVNPQLEAISGGEPLSFPMLLLLLALIAGLAPFAEELFFRGMIYPWLRQRWGHWVAIGGSAAIFSMIHFIPILMPALFFIGIILGVLRERSHSTVPCIILHMMQNAIVVLSMNMLLSQG